MTKPKAKLVPNPVRAALAVTMRASLADQEVHHDWTYAAVRPLSYPGKQGAGYPVGNKRSDCSWGVRLNCWWTKDTPDPMLAGFNDSGNSSTLCARLVHVETASELEVGDIITIGVNGGEHACQVLIAGSDPTVWSDGHQGAPNSFPISADTRWPKQYLRLPLPDVPETPKEKLREKTGYWAWMQWLLGEGSWRNYLPKEADVRPNVPRVIPTSWWLARAKYLLARKKGNPPTTQGIATS